MPIWLSRTIPMSKYFSGSRPLRHNEVQLYFVIWDPETIHWVVDMSVAVLCLQKIKKPYQSCMLLNTFLWVPVAKLWVKVSWFVGKKSVCLCLKFTCFHGKHFIHPCFVSLQRYSYGSMGVPRYSCSVTPSCRLWAWRTHAQTPVCRWSVCSVCCMRIVWTSSHTGSRRNGEGFKILGVVQVT